MVAGLYRRAELPWVAVVVLVLAPGGTGSGGAGRMPISRPWRRGIATVCRWPPPNDPLDAWQAIQTKAISSTSGVVYAWPPPDKVFAGMGYVAVSIVRWMLAHLPTIPSNSLSLNACIVSVRTFPCDANWLRQCKTFWSESALMTNTPS